MTQDNNPTTRRFPRSTPEAFKDERARSIEPPSDDDGLRSLWYGIAAIVFVVLLLLLTT